MNKERKVVIFTVFNMILHVLLGTPKFLSIKPSSITNNT